MQLPQQMFAKTITEQNENVKKLVASSRLIDFGNAKECPLVFYVYSVQRTVCQLWKSTSFEESVNVS